MFIFFHVFLFFLFSSDVRPCIQTRRPVLLIQMEYAFLFLECGHSCSFHCSVHGHWLFSQQHQNKGRLCRLLIQEGKKKKNISFYYSHNRCWEEGLTFFYEDFFTIHQHITNFTNSFLKKKQKKNRLKYFIMRANYLHVNGNTNVL